MSASASTARLGRRKISISAARQPARPLRLPALREDLQLFESAPERDGAPSWTIQDPIDNRFFRIGWLEFECLLRWSMPGGPAAIAADIAHLTPLAAETGQVEAFADFLLRHKLLRSTPDPAPDGLAKAVKGVDGGRWLQWRWWLHHYLFFRIPLLRPGRWLDRLLPWLAPLGTPLGLMLIAFSSLTGLLLVARQWDHFTHSVAGLLSPAGALGFALALAVGKSAHELGHALVATRHGVRVAHMGVAFVVLWPMLYTDTGESWKLRDSRQRLLISSAGVLVELCLAGLATLAWGLLDDGPLRLAMLYLATTGWIMTLALNASPFMRFDGYFILSDLVDFPNLHERAGAFARTALRRTLLGWDEPWPEALPAATRRALTAFALATWIYRLIVFAGIAVAVYLMFFKLLGIFLFAVEVGWFIARPIYNEMAVWKKHWPKTPTARRRLFKLGAGAALILLAMPWPTAVHAPALAHSARQQFVFSPFAARLETLHPAGPVRAGTLLAGFENPDLAARAYRADVGLAALHARLAGVEADESAADRRRATAERLGEQQAEAQAAADEAFRLRIAAEFDGLWLDLDPYLRPANWIGNREAVGLLVDPAAWVVDAYVEQRQIERLSLGAGARFYPHGRPRAFAGKVIDIDATRSPRLPSPALDATHGGPIATLPADAKDKNSHAGRPSEALYRVRVTLDEAPPAWVHNPQQTRGMLVVSAAPHSLLWQWLKAGLAVLVRESGF